MSGTYVTNIADFLDSSGQIVPEMPEEARQLAGFLVLIIDAATPRRSTGFYNTRIRCRMKDCEGAVIASMNAAQGEIQWACDVCKHNGVIRNWENTKWDRRAEQ